MTTYNTLSDDGNAAATAEMALAGAAPNPDEEIVTIATYQSIVEADLVRSELESRGIPAYVSGATIAQTFVSMPETGITVQVASSNAAVARQVADELVNAAPIIGDGDSDDDEEDVDAYDESDTDLATPPGADSSDDADYEYDVNEDDEDAAEQVDAAEATSSPRQPTAVAAVTAVFDREPEVDLQRKPGIAAQGQHMYDDAEAGG